jgi:hypothetical protein
MDNKPKKGEPDVVEKARPSDGAHSTYSGNSDGKGGIDKSEPHSHIVQKDGEIVYLRREEDPHDKPFYNSGK